jgi:hypothetical protein
VKYTYILLLRRDYDGISFMLILCHVCMNVCMKVWYMYVPMLCCMHVHTIITYEGYIPMYLPM